MISKLLLWSGFTLASLTAAAQDDDLLRSVDSSAPARQPVYNAFKSSRVIMSHSMEMLQPGVLDFRILHRFGRVNGGPYEFFGLDGPATVRLGLDYGLTQNFTIGIGRSTFNKEVDGFLKGRILQQSTGPHASPLSLVAVGGITWMTQKFAANTRPDNFSSRLAYYAQLIAGRKFSERVTLQLMPTYLHRNYVGLAGDQANLFAAGIGGRVKVSHRISLNADYYYVADLNTAAGLHNPLSIGVDIETGGHVFQLHFTNAKGMNERSFLSATEFDWGNGDIFFGFNISRSFQLGKRHKK